MKEDSAPMLEAAREALAAACGDFDAAAVEAALAPLPDRFGVKPGRLYQPIRVAITGTSVSPGIFESVAVLGRGFHRGADFGRYFTPAHARFREEFLSNPPGGPSGRGIHPQFWGCAG